MFLGLSLVAVILMGLGAIFAVFSLIGLGFKAVVRLNEPTLTNQEGEMLTKHEMELFRYWHCPDCGADLLQGPRGGMSVNYECARSRCGSRFNVIGPFGVERTTNASPKKGTVILMHDEGPFRS